MTFDEFKTVSNLTSVVEVEKVCLLAYFSLKSKGTQEFTVADAVGWLTQAGFASPNTSRLLNNLSASRNTIKGRGGFRLAPRFVQALEQKFPKLSRKSQDVLDEGTILPELEYSGTRGYIERIAKQVNACYEHNLFDGCAVLMRRLVEILLILAYRHLRIEDVIKDGNGNYLMLEAIVANAKGNAVLDLSRNSRKSLDVFRELGNFSAHKIEYTCRREYIAEHILGYRALITELLHKSGIRV